MNVPVVWVNYNPDRPAGPDPYWDNAIVDWLLTDAWAPGMPTFTYHWSFEDVHPSSGVIVVTPGHYGREGIRQLNEAIEGHPWALVIITSDEEGAFPAWEIEHPNLRVWKQHPSTRVEWWPDMALPLGWRPGTREHFAGSMPPKKELPFWFGGQGGKHRQAMIDQLSPSDLLYITDGFARGIEQDEYLDLLAAAREAPCPPGPNTPDTFRLYEALEAGCQPVVDQPTMHFLMKYGDNAPVISCRWDAIGSFGSPFELADNGARWQTWKRRLAYQLRDDIDLLSGAERFWSDTDQITVLISTSPSILHPDTAIIDETIQSIRDRLPRSEILIMCDGVRPEQQDLTDQYLEYLRRVVWKSMHHWSNVYPIVMGEFVHQAEATRRTLPMVHTPLVLFVEHDTPLIGEIPFDRLAQIVTKEDMVIRLHHEARVHPEHEHLNASELIRRRDVWLQPTVQWSQRPHLARTEKYRRLLADWFTPDSRTFIEDKMHGVVHHGKWATWKVALYHPEGDIKRSTHTDGRAGQPKYEVKF